jgi:WhiB family redox-sensing transcriptional regulator
VYQAACATADPEIFFTAGAESDAAAKQYCTACPVRNSCSDYALAAREEFGVWGGLTEGERKTLLSKAKRAQVARPAEGAA